MSVKAIETFKGCNEIRFLNKSSINMASTCSDNEMDATGAFRRTREYTAEDIGFTTGNHSSITVEKSGARAIVTNSLDQRTTNIQNGDETFFNGVNRSGASAIDVIPIVNTSNPGLMSSAMLDILNNYTVRKNQNNVCTSAFKLQVPSQSTSWINTKNNDIAVINFNSYNGFNPWIKAANASNHCMIGNYNNALYLGIVSSSKTDNSLDNHIALTTTAASTIGTWTASKNYNAVWNDYAEFFERGSKSEPGDIIMMDIDSDKEQYMVATRGFGPVIGVHSDTFAQLIGGEKQPDGQPLVDHALYNMPRFIPIGLAGRVLVKCLGPIKKGDKICLHESLAGVGRVVRDYEKDKDYIVGIACESYDNNTDIARIKMFIKLGV